MIPVPKNDIIGQLVTFSQGLHIGEDYCITVKFLNLTVGLQFCKTLSFGEAGRKAYKNYSYCLSFRFHPRYNNGKPLMRFDKRTVLL